MLAMTKMAMTTLTPPMMKVTSTGTKDDANDEGDDPYIYFSYVKRRERRDVVDVVVWDEGDDRGFTFLGSRQVRAGPRLLLAILCHSVECLSVYCTVCNCACVGGPRVGFLHCPTIV